MNSQLKKDSEQKSDIMRETLSLAERFFARQEELSPGIYVPDIPLDVLPDEGCGAQDVLESFEKNYAHLVSNSAGGRYFGFVTGGSTPASIAGDWLVSVFDQNACGSNDSIAPQIEHQTMNYFRQLFGLDTEYFGSFVSGATMSNFVGLALARQWVGEQYGVDPSSEGLGGFPLGVLSATPHSSVLKSLAMLGIGRNAIIKVATETDREAVDVRDLEQLLSHQKGSVIVVANAGTVNTGDFDDLKAIGSLKNKYKFWMHVDAAFGGFAACSEKYSYLMEGINHADSITIDAHKWLNVPYDAAMQFTRHKAVQLKVFQNSAAYLGDPATSPDFFHYTPENSRRWRALPSWFTLRAYGKSGYRDIVERNCSLAKKLGARLQASEDFTLLSPVRLNIVCFSLRQPNVSSELIKTFLNAVRDQGAVFLTPTVYKGRAAIRAAVSNWQTNEKDIDIAFDAICHVHRGLATLGPGVAKE